MEVTGELSDEFINALELAVARKDSQVTTVTTSLATSSGSATTATATVTTTASKSAPVTGYTFNSVSTPDSTDNTIFVLVSGMIITLAMGTAIVYLKNKVVSKKK